MIRKLARLEAPVPVVLEMFRDTESWPEWMPSVASTRVLGKDQGHRLVEVVILCFGRRLVQKLECREDAGRLTHRQVEGWFRTWNAVWTFQPPPEGEGTTLSLTLDFDLGLTGRLVPLKRLESWVGGLIDGTIDQGRRRARRFARSRCEPPQAVQLGRPLLQVFETADGFEFGFAGPTFHIEAGDLRESADP